MIAADIDTGENENWIRKETQRKRLENFYNYLEEEHKEIELESKEKENTEKSFTII